MPMPKKVGLLIIPTLFLGCFGGEGEPTKPLVSTKKYLCSSYAAEKTATPGRSCVRTVDIDYSKLEVHAYNSPARELYGYFRDDDILLAIIDPSRVHYIHFRKNLFEILPEEKYTILKTDILESNHRAHSEFDWQDHKLTDVSGTLEFVDTMAFADDKSSTNGKTKVYTLNLAYDMLEIKGEVTITDQIRLVQD